jgi:hypothetical protein
MSNNELQPVPPPTPEEEEIDVSYFFEYLHSEKGHEVMSRVLSMVEDLKKAGLDRTSEHIKSERWLQVGVISLVIVASTFLTYVGKFDTSLGVMFGTMVGYLFGKRSA